MRFKDHRSTAMSKANIIELCLAEHCRRWHKKILQGATFADRREEKSKVP